jgi:small subunit ribosomal protein S4
MHIGYYGTSPLISESHPERPVQVATSLADGAGGTLKARADARQARERPPERGGGGKKKKGRR